MENVGQAVMDSSQATKLRMKRALWEQKVVGIKHD